ncbi:MAG TPA: YdcF family protein [Candidatus Acidoferrum sp.]|nr:YdcF family protein [Candidatus Acidoferrum sp.]
MTVGRRLREHPFEKGGILFSLIMTVVVVLVLAVLYLARHPIFRLVGEGWVVEDTLERSDAILVLSDDNFYADRATRASQVYRQGLGPIVVASGRRLRPYAGIAELMEHDLIERGVPKDKILRVAHDANNTREEATTLAQTAKQKKWRSVIVVTSNFHTRRARYIFSHVFPEDIRIRITGAGDGDFDPERWWEKRVSVKELIREMAAMLVAIWEQHGGSDVTDKSQIIVAPHALNAPGVV